MADAKQNIEIPEINFDDISSVAIVIRKCDDELSIRTRIFITN